MYVQVQFSYSVKWTQTTMVFDDRLQRYERFPLNPIHLEVRQRLQPYQQQRRRTESMLLDDTCQPNRDVRQAYSSSNRSNREHGMLLQLQRSKAFFSGSMSGRVYMRW
jgi:hypothetical protein